MLDIEIIAYLNVKCSGKISKEECSSWWSGFYETVQWDIALAQPLETTCFAPLNFTSLRRLKSIWDTYLSSRTQYYHRWQDFSSLP